MLAQTLQTAGCARPLGPKLSTKTQIRLTSEMSCWPSPCIRSKVCDAPASDSLNSAPTAVAPPTRPARSCCARMRRHLGCTHNLCAAPGSTHSNVPGPAPSQVLHLRSRAAASPGRRRRPWPPPQGRTSNGTANGTWRRSGGASWAMLEAGRQKAASKLPACRE